MVVVEGYLSWDNNTWNYLNCVQVNDWYQKELFVLDRNTWNHLTVYKQMSPHSFENKLTYK